MIFNKEKTYPGESIMYLASHPSMSTEEKKREKILYILQNFKQLQSLKIYFQPQYISENNSLYGFEALLRIVDDEIGKVFPAEFIPVAEETGLIIDIGYWCIRECCKTAKRFIKMGAKFSAIAINISIVQLMSPGFVSEVKSIILEENIDPSFLSFEITESILMHSVEYGADILSQLKDFGIGIVLDDFGSGYSSLNYIRALSIDTLKIDKTFIDSICTDDKSKYIVEMILNLAKKIDLEVVAEGVETIDQLNELKKISCPIIQGHYYNKPMSEGDIKKII